MRVAVLGAGAVGCYFGGLLARAGHDVLFVGRKPHVDAINADGLLLDTTTFSEHVPARATTDAVAIDRPDLILVCVKSGDSEDAGKALAGRLSPETIVLSLQNGVDNAERLAAILGRNVEPAIVYAGVEMAGPGHVKHHGRGELVIGASERSFELGAALRAAGVPTQVFDDIRPALWTKLVVNCAYNALSAIGALPYGRMVLIEGAREVMADAVAECATVARAAGVTLSADLLETTLALATAMPNQYSSTAQDVSRGKPTEIDFLNGYVVRRGRELGVPTPTNRALQVATHLVEAARP
ncbi:MAG: 2-dehydropantoate 2-reductase [Rhodoblastus sp.]|nr:2-dehydropantoate 2-reductase [Rhodoblastus sp.]